MSASDADAGAHGPSRSIKNQEQDRKQESGTEQITKFQFVTLELTFVLNAEAAMPTSPASSRPSALRLPGKSNVGPTCPSSGLLGSVGVTCLNTCPATATWSRSILKVRAS